MKTYRCEWGGMYATYEAETAGKARIMALKCIREWWDDRASIVDIKVHLVREKTGVRHDHY